MLTRYLIPLAFLIGYGANLNAGQISVINPSAGVSISISMPSAPSANPSSSSAVTLPSTNSSENIGKKGISVFVLETLETTDISTFAISQLTAALNIIKSGLESSQLSEDIRSILLAEQQQLLELIEKKK